jgi:hypothetical protein
MTRWEAGVSAPRDGRVFVGAWSIMRGTRRAWRYAFIYWDICRDEHRQGFVINQYAIGAAQKLSPMERDGRIHVARQRRVWVAPPVVWTELAPPDLLERVLKDDP